MFLTSLAMRGFKSFADRCVLDVEPGITVIVGPNGSGKSNVVDALAWVLGTHSPKKVRGGHMADVIFAGSPTRKALGRARVEITIDNADGQLGTAALGTGGSAQQFSEVRVAREIDAAGDSTYRINGEEVRALDVQELLSDTGLGRELHTVVGQGQLDAILNAKPEDRRAYVEEAAGILKHRRRRERALRKLDQVDGHIDKLRTVLRELRRQLRPLERQAEAADQHTRLQAQLRDTQVHLAAVDLARVHARGERDAAADEEVDERHAAAERTVAVLEEQVGDAERALADAGPRAEQAKATYYRLSSLRERLNGTNELIEARRRHLVEYVEEPLAGRPPDELRAQAERLDTQRDARQAEHDQHREQLEAATATRRQAEQDRRAHELAVQAEARRHAEARERVLRWEGEVFALRGAIASSEAEVGRVGSQLTGLDGRVAEAEAEVVKVSEEASRLDADEVELTATVEQAEVRLGETSAIRDEQANKLRDLDTRRSYELARAEALRAALADRDGGLAALLDAGLPGVIGPVADHVRIDGDAQGAVAAALGALGEAVVVATADDARDAIAWLRRSGAGSATVLPAAAGPAVTVRTTHIGATGVRPLAECLTPAGGDPRGATVVDALRGVLARVHVVDDWSRAVALHAAHPQAIFVTREGDMAGPDGYHGGQAPADSSVLTANAAAEAEQRAAALAEESEALTARLADDEDAVTAAQRVLTEATERINESDARIAAAVDRLARLNKELVGLANQREIVAAQHHELSAVLRRDREALSELNSRGPDVAETGEHSGDTGREAEQLDTAVEAAREAELELRVRLERGTEQILHLELQADALRAESDEVEAALAEAARRRERRRAGIERCGELALLCADAVTKLEASIRDSEARRDELETALGARRAEVDALREQRRNASRELESVREERHAADLRRSDLDHERAAIAERLRTTLSLTPDEVLAEHPDASDDDRDALVESEDLLVRKLGMLGRVNPLALEEFKALEERHRFLSDQLDDLRRSKRDLAEVVEAVDARIAQVFTEAFDDIAVEFERIFAVVFPGGHGRLVLTDPDSPLTTGIEVEARPPGKRVTRLSLLSGGERSLTVLAFVFAIFKARPSPFYVLDEVDAALDDVNLVRLLEVIESFRGQAQIIMVTHQKRSMEIADILYGVTMGPDAVTKVVADRLRDVPAERATA